MAFEIECRECDWKAPEPVDLKGEANWLAGRHISDTGHSVAIRELDPEEALADEDDFYRGGSDRGRVVQIVGPPPGSDPASDPEIERR